MQEYLQTNHNQVPVEVETRTLEEVKELLQLVQDGKAKHVTRIMLDNMTSRDPERPGRVSKLSLGCPKATALLVASVVAQHCCSASYITLVHILSSLTAYAKCNKCTSICISKDFANKYMMSQIGFKLDTISVNDLDYPYATPN